MTQLELLRDRIERIRKTADQTHRRTEANLVDALSVIAGELERQRNDLDWVMERIERQP